MRSINRASTALLVALGLLVLPLATGVSDGASSSSYPMTIKAADGTFTFTSRPTSIVSLSPTATEILFAIGAGPQVKAVDSDSDYPPNAPRTKLSAYTPNVEAIAKYDPTWSWSRSIRPSFNTQMAALKIPVIDEPTAANLAAAYAQYTSLGRATGRVAQAAAEVAKVKRKIASIVASTPRAPKGSTYYYEIDPTYYSVTSSTFVGQLFALFGLKSIADGAKGVAASGGYPQLSEEFILKSNPTISSWPTRSAVKRRRPRSRRGRAGPR